MNNHFRRIYFLIIIVFVFQVMLPQGIIFHTEKVLAAEKQLNGILFSNAPFDLDVGGTYPARVMAVFSDGSTQDVTDNASFQISEPTVAVVNPNGIITGVSKGSTEIKAFYSGKSVSAVVKVDAPDYGQGTGLLGQYYDNSDLTNRKVLRVDSSVYFNWGSGSPDTSIDKDTFSIRWNGLIQSEFSENYTFHIQAHGGARLWINGQLLIDKWGKNGTISESATTFLNAGKLYDIRIEYNNIHGLSLINLEWSSPSQPNEIVPKNFLFPLGTPKNFKVSSHQESQVLTWDPLDFATGYDVEINGTVIDNSSATSYVNNNLKDGTINIYRVRAKSGNIIGPWCPPEVNILPLESPSNIVSAVTSDSITLSWENIHAAIGYDLDIDGQIINVGSATTYLHSDVSPGSQHIYRVRAKSEDITGQWSQPVEVTSIFKAPQNFTAKASATSVILGWQAIEGATSYEIDADGIVVTGITGSNYIHENLDSSTTHQYKIRGMNESVIGEWSNTIQVMTLPSIPANIKAEATETAISVEWQQVQGATGYDIEVDGVVIDNALNTVYTHSNLLPGSEHFYRVRAKNQGGEGVWSQIVGRTALPGTQLNIETNVQDTWVALIWNAATEAIGYDVEVDGIIIDTGANTHYLHSNLLSNTPHTYRVRARTSGGAAMWSLPVTITTLPSIPGNLSVEPSSTSATITWDAVIGAAGYDVEVDGVVIDNGTNTIYKHTGLAPNQQHTYRVRARNTAVAGNWSVAVISTTLPDASFDIRTSVTDTTVNVSWNPVAGAIGYDIEVDGVVINNGNGTSYIHSGLLPDSMHRYRVRARNTGGVTIWSNLVTVSTGIAIPQNITTSAMEKTIVLTWDAVSGAVSYEVEVDGVINDNGTSTRFVHNNLTIGQLHQYRLRAKGQNGYSDWSTPISLAPQPVSGEGVGLLGEYYEDGFSENPVIVRVDNTVNFDWGSRKPDPSIDKDTFVIRWTGQFQPKYTENYTIFTETHGGVRLWIDNQLVIDYWLTNDMIREQVSILLEAGRKYDVRLEYNHGYGVALARLFWSSDSQKKEIIPQSQLYPVGTPGDLHAEAGVKRVNLSWRPVMGATSYELEADDSIVYTGSEASFVHQNLTPGTEHVYRVRAKLGELIGGWSEKVTAAILLGTPQGITAQTSRTSITLQWDPVEGAEVYDIEVDGAWINVGGNTKYIHSNLIPGTKHTYRVRARSSKVVGDWSGEITKTTLLAVPSDIRAVSTEETIKITWESITNAQSYDVEVDGIVIENGQSREYTHVGLTAGTEHTYRVRAKNDDVTGEWSMLIRKWTIPAIPQNINAEPTSYSITVTWDEVPGASAYEIEVSGTPVDVGLDTVYTHEGLNPNTQRTYRVRAKNAGGAGKWSEIIAQSTLPGTLYTITATPTSDSITVTWDPASGATGYDIEVDGNVISDITDTRYIHSGLLPSTEHTYRIRPKNTDGISDWSQTVRKTTLPEMPEGMQAIATGDSIIISWAEAMGASGYEIEVDGIICDNGTNTTYTHDALENNTEHTYRVRAKYKENRSPWSEMITRSTLPGVPGIISTTAVGNKITITWNVVQGATYYEIEIDGVVTSVGLTTRYVHEGLIPNMEHMYRVRAISSAGAGGWSEAVKKSTSIGIPRNVTATAAHDSITLHWDAAEGATTYEVIADGTIVEAGAETTYTDKGLRPNTLHVYRVRAKSGETAGEWTEPLIITTIQGVPGNIRTKIASTYVIVLWDSVDGATGYEIQVDGIVIDVKAEQSFFHEGLKPNSKHEYYVRSKKGDVASPWSKAVNVTTAPGIPVNLRATVDTNEIHVLWDVVQGAENYQIEVDGEILGYVVDSPGYTHQGLVPNTRHTYRVRALSSGGASEWSELLEKNTMPVLAINAGKDNMFNFVFVVPKKWDVDTRTITVKYNPDELEVVDLCAVTPALETKSGKIEGTNITVKKFIPGEIVYTVDEVQKTVVNSIKFISKVSGHSKVVYTIE